jgi:hypothetical protein
MTDIETVVRNQNGSVRVEIINPQCEFVDDAVTIVNRAINIIDREKERNADRQIRENHKDIGRDMIGT